MTACDTAETILCIASSERSGGVMFGDADGVAAMAGDVSTLAALVAVVDAAVVRRRRKEALGAAAT